MLPMLNNFVNKLESRLKLELPGIDAQRLMMPVEGSSERFDLNKKDVKRGGVLILFYVKDSQIYIPLTQRHDYKGTHGGQVSLPGGKIEPSDGSLIDTALRETHEEIGISRSAINVMGTLTDLYIPPSNFRVTPVVGFIDYLPKFKLDAFEVKELIETPLSWLTDDKKLKQKEIIVRNQFSINAPYFDIQEKIVWGATAMILSELRTIIKEID